MNTANAVIGKILGGLFALGLVFSASPAAAEPPAGFSQPELDQMLAPIALYPDTVLSHVLIAATYPLEVVQAARWSRANPGFSGEYAVEAVEHMPWDPSVMALVAFPELLARLDADLVWTQRLGDAFLVQEYQVLDTIQYLRDEAYAAGHLRSNEYVRVVREPSYIYIEPAVTRVVYVPYYDPRVVYGAWRYSAFPPIYWDHPRGYRSGFSFHWSSGYHVQPAFFFSSFHWSSRKVVVHNHYRYGHRDHGSYAYGGHKFSSGRELAHYKDARHWKHNPEHRRGVAYSRGIDERHAIKASTRSDRYVNDRRDLLRQRSRTAALTTRRSNSRTTSSDTRSRLASERTQRNRSAVQRGDNNIRETAAAGRRSTIASTSRSASSRASQPDTRGRSLDRASTRRELAHGRASAGRSAPRTDSRASSQNRARDIAPDRTSSRQELARGRAALGRTTPRSDSRVTSRNRTSREQARPATRQSSSRLLSQSSSRLSSQSSTRPSSRLSSRLSSQSSSQSSSRSSSRSSSQSSSQSALRSPSRSVTPTRSTRSDRAVQARSRPSAASSRSASRSSGQAISRKSTQRATGSSRRANASSQSTRAEAPRQARPRSGGNRTEVLRSRSRDRRQ